MALAKCPIRGDPNEEARGKKKRLTTRLDGGDKMKT